ncbi:MAG: hypothetical protein COS68_01685 [Elusimicrobia bacterium CG06_land_8_20_14_3_00_38_11]|nr:MAG: hypothetical protein COS68_01685 [Elusimicrobia bacterium CG06_land_8_20_14_3_00_38_11]
MKIFSDRYPTNIPYLVSGFIGVNLIVFGWTAFIAEIYIGRPSSTHCIGFIFLPVYTVLVLLICFVVGLVVRFVVGKFVPSRIITKRSNQIINISFVCSIIVAFLSGILLIKYQEWVQRPHIIFDAGRIIKINLSTIKIIKKTSESKFVFTTYVDEKSEAETFIWNGKKIHFAVGNSIAIRDENENNIATADLRKYDYIGRIHVIQLAIDNSASKGLAVLVRLRATSHRSMLLIYDSDAKLVYQELLNRNKNENIMNINTDVSGKEYIYVDIDKPIMYSTIENENYKK